MTTSSGPSFISYVSEAEKDIERDQKIAEAMSKLYERPEKELENRLLNGEVAIGHAKKVIRYNVHDDPTRGISGTLVCTNFRLCFITAEKATYDLIELQNRLLNDHDILLNNIDSIFVEYPNKRKRLVPGSKVKDGIQRLELHCKDFRVAAFNFKLTVKGEEKGVIKAILHHAYPSAVSLLFAFDHEHGRNISEVCKVPLYRSPPDWDSELRRCEVAKKKWRITAINRHYLVSTSMPAYLVVPSSITDGELSSAADRFNGNRLPVWCWTDRNGCSLVRAASLRPEVEQQKIEDDLYKAIRDTDPKKRPLKVIEVNRTCPSCLQLQQSFNKLRSLCMPGFESEFWETDAHWNTSLQSSKWLQHISATLETAKTAAAFLREKEHNVIIKETSGVDLASVLTSLIQLILDPTCRTLEGFQALIQREWVVAGHPFLERLGHLVQPTKKGKQTNSASTGDHGQQAPVFLLFLDCVWQLMVQFPARFEPSTTFLTVLYDATRMTAFETFIFNNERERDRAPGTKEGLLLQEIDRDSPWQFLPVWAWDLQFNKTDMALFYNPLYKMRTMDNYSQYVESISSASKRRRRLLSGGPVTLPFELKIDGDANNGDVHTRPSSRTRGTSFLDEDIKKTKSPTRGGKKKTSLKEKRTEEHRKKIGMDNPLPIKTKQKNTHTRNPSDGLIRGQSIEECSKTENPDVNKGHFPKVALMPKQRHSAPEHPPSRSRSAGDLNGEEAENLGVNGEDVITPLPDSQRKPPESTSPKTKTRWSVRRKKPKDNQGAELSFDGVPTYNLRMQDVSMQRYHVNTATTASLPLYPQTSLPKLRFWKSCYFRWLPWSQIFGGGPAAMMQQESILYDEIHILHNKLQALERNLQGEHANFHSSGEEDSLNLSGVYFSFTSPQGNDSVFEPNANKFSSQTSLNLLSSYFPYSPLKDLRRKSIIGTPISNFLQGGSLFNFGRSRTKHSRSPSTLSITHSLNHSVEDISSATGTDSAGDTLSPASKSLEDLAADPATTPPSGHNDRNRTQSDTYVRNRLKRLDVNAMKPLKKPSAPNSPTENVTYITSL